MRLNWVVDASKHFCDPNLKIPDSHLKKVCRLKSGEKTCRYLSLTGAFDAVEGYICVKNTPFKPFIDDEVANNPQWRAHGNNCDGFTSNAENKKDNKKDDEKSNSSKT